MLIDLEIPDNFLQVMENNLRNSIYLKEMEKEISNIIQRSRIERFSKGFYYLTDLALQELYVQTGKESPTFNNEFVLKFIGDIQSRISPTDPWYSGCPYGLCDTPEQFIQRYTELLESLPYKVYVRFDFVFKEHQPPNDGFRFHKNGPYIGEKEICTEYLADSDLDYVTAFNVSLVE